MTNLEALQATVAGYPLATNVYQKALTDRSLTASDTYAGTSQSFELAKADVYTVLSTAVNIQEGGYNLSMTDKSNFLKAANAIYERYGYPSVMDGARKIKGVNPW